MKKERLEEIKQRDREREKKEVRQVGYSGERHTKT
jgi:hypothetical protein